MPAAQAAAEAAAAAAEALESSALPEDLDEFGRDRNMEKRRESSARCWAALLSCPCRDTGVGSAPTMMAGSAGRR